MISVVIPAFNAGHFIKRTIDSVLAQTLPADEIIVVDDGSTDNTAQVVKSYGEKVRYIYQENAGDGPARNTGIRSAKNEWIAFLDHDDEWLPEKLQLQMELLRKLPDLYWCAGNFYRKSGDRCAVAVESDKIYRALAGKECFDSFFKAILTLGSNFMSSTLIVRKEAFDRAGLFESCWLRAADQDMWWRIAYHFPRIGYVAQPLAVLHVEPQDVKSTKLRLAAKTGRDARKLIARHLELAKRYDRLDEFEPVAKRYLRVRLLTAIFHGFRNDAREMILQFPQFFPYHWRIGTYLLTIFPNLTSAVLRGIAYLRHLLGLEKQISRRWITLEDVESRRKPL